MGRCQDVNIVVYFQNIPQSGDYEGRLASLSGSHPPSPGNQGRRYGWWNLISTVVEGIGRCQVPKLKYDAERCTLTEHQFFLLYLLQAALSLR